MFFIHPHYLWLLLLVVPLVWQHRRHGTSLGVVSLWAVAAVRALAMVAIVVALAQPVLVQEDLTRTVVHVVDISAGMDTGSLGTVIKDVEHAIKREKENKRHEVVFFAKRPWRLESVASLHEEMERLCGNLDPSLLHGSNLAAALDRAAACVPDGVAGEVLLYSDGRATEGNTAAASRDLARRGLSLKTIVTGKSLSPELVLHEVQAAATAMLDETLSVRVVLETTDAQVVRIVVTDATGEKVAERQASLSAGRQTLDLTLPVTLSETASLEVHVQGEKDTVASNNRKGFAVSVLPAYHVGLIGSGETTPLEKLLGASAAVEKISPESLSTPINSGSLAKYDLVVLADTPADALGTGATTELARAVEGGCGLLVTGGRRSFGPGGYLDGPLAELLPVRSVQKREQRDPSTTLVIILDTSGSMGGARVPLAKEIARLAVRRLKPHDKVGVVEFYGSKRWAAPIQPASNTIDINRALNRLSGGGGTVLLPAIEEAYYALLNVRTRTRHILILTDGGVETGAFEPLIRKMADHGITLSTVLVGPDSHSAFLTRLAQWGHGKSYHAPNRFNLPEILIKQPESSLLDPWIEQPTRMVPADRSVLTDATNFTHAPLVRGYVETEPRRTADVLLRSTLGHPILARWQYGLGHIAAVTTELAGPWSEELAAWEGYGPLMAGLARSLVQRSKRIPIQLNCTTGPEGLTVLAKATSMNRADSVGSLELTATTEWGEEVYHAILEPVRPGQWLARIPLSSLSMDASEHGTVLNLEAKTSTGIHVSGATVVGRADEFCSIMPAKERMASWEQTCRREQARIKEQGATPVQAVLTVPLRGTMIAVALILFFMQVALRRLLPSRRARVSTADSGSPKPISVASKGASTVVSIMVLLFLGMASANAVASEAKPPEPRRLPEKVVQQVQKAYLAGNQEQAHSLLTKEVAKSPLETSIALHAARLAWICGDAKTAAELFKPTGEEKERCREELLFGTLLLETDHPVRAMTHFNLAYQAATTAADRRFGVAMHVHGARRAKRLGKLADQWLAEKDLPPERGRALVQILGELDRYDDAFRLIERPDLENDLAENLQKDIVSLAIDAGKTDRAAAVYRRLLQDRPDHMPSLSAVARLFLLDGRRDEAVQLFDDAIRATDPAQSKDLVHLADAAAGLALYDQTRAALDRAAEASDATRVRAVIQKADLARREGKPEEAKKLLASLPPVLQDRPKQLLAVAEAYENHGDRAEAITLLEQLYKQTESEDVLARIAWLSEESERWEQAYELWLKLWRQTKVAARRHQAKMRLLDLASRTGKLAELTADLKEKLDENRATCEEVLLLVDIYSQANDSVATSEILGYCEKHFGDQLETARRLVRVYLDCNFFDRAESQLRKLVKIDPENAADYLRQIAMLAAEQGRPNEAGVAVKELERLSDSKNARGDAMEFSAGIFERLGMIDEAIAAYEKVLAERPERIEVLLLWGRAMKQAGRGDEAVARMLRIAGTCKQDDRFVIAIDGLLNLEAKPDVLRDALALVLRRIAADGEKVFLYDLAADLFDSLGEPDQKRRILRQSLIAAGMRRASILRQLMDEAIANVDNASTNRQVVDYGHLLLMLGDEVPPSVFLQIGKTMLDANDVKAAATFFRRAGVHGDFAGIGRQVVKFYEAADQPRRAESLVHELLITEPDAIDLLLQAGGLSEQRGRFSQAFASYLKAVECLLDGVPTTSQRCRGMDLAELDLSLDVATIGLIVSAREEQSWASVVDTLSQGIEKELADLKKDGLLRPTLAENPQLARRVAQLRHIALALHKTTCLESIDQTLLANYPEDKTLREKMVDTYLDWGLIQKAAMLAQPLPEASRPTTLQLYRLLKEDDALEKFLGDSKRSTVLAERLIPILLAKGRVEEVKRLLADLPESEQQAEVARLVAAAINEDDIVGNPKIPQNALPQRPLNPFEMGRRLATIPLEQRPAALEKALKRQPEDRRRSYLLELLWEVDSLNDKVLSGMIADRFCAAPPMRMREETAFVQLARVPWYRLETPAGKAAAVKIAKQLLADHGSMTSVVALNTIAASRADSDKKTTIDSVHSRVLDAIMRILLRKNLKEHEQPILKELIDSLPAAEMAVLETLYEEQVKQNGTTLALALAKAYLCERQGDARGQLAALQKVFSLQPDDMASFRGYVDAMQKLGRYAELVDVLAKNRKGASGVPSYEWRTMADLYCRLYRFDDAIRAAKKDEAPLALLRVVKIEAARGDTERTLRELRRFFIQNRKDRRFFTPTWTDGPGRLGMEGYREKVDASGSVENKETLLTKLADQPYAVDEWGAMLRAATPDRRDVAALVEGYAKALQLAGKADEMLATIQKRETRGTANRKDRLLWLTLQSTNQNSKEKASSAARLDETLLELDWSDSRAVARLAEVLRTAGKTEEARCLFRWAVALGQRDDGTDVWESVDLLEREVVAYRQRLARKSSRPSRDAWAILASLEAALDRFDDFRQTLSEALDAKPENVDAVEVWDYRRLLPPAETRTWSASKQYVAEVIKQMESRHAQGKIFRAELVRALCLLADWQRKCKPSGNAKGVNDATMLENKIAALVKAMEADGRFEFDPSTTLWLIDHYHQIGNTDEAYRLSMRLLFHRTYPPARFPWIFNEIKKRDGQKKFEEALRAAKSYSGHPILTNRIN